jgi:peptide/nickel transport system permease protein
MRRISWLALISAVILLIVILFATVGAWVLGDSITQDALLGVTPPGTPGHIFGTDVLGRDIVALSIAGTQSAVIGPVAIALGSMLLGMLLGTVSGYQGGWIDLLLSKYADLLLALPVTLVALVVAGLVGGGYWVTVVVLVVLFSPTDIRMMRSAVMTQSTRPYIESAKVLGLSRWRIMFRHILPNVIPIAIATMLLNVAFALVAMSALSFLGLGVGPGEPDWGRQLADGRNLLTQNPAAVIVPGLLLILTATAINLTGDWVQERYSARAEAIA